MTRAAPTTRAKTEKAIYLTMTKTVTCQFESDNDEEIDAAEIEEEEWVEYIKRSTNEAMEKMEN